MTTLAIGWPSQHRVVGVLVIAAMALFLSIHTPTAAAAPSPFADFGANCGIPQQVINGECSGAGETTVPRGVAVSPTTGNVYVADQFNHRIDEFTPWGGLLRAWGWGVTDGAPELQTCTTVSGCREGTEGAGAGEFRSAQGVALDSAGNVYVVDLGNHRVQKFDAEGHFLLMFGGNVDKGPLHPGAVCTATSLAEGDQCGAGTRGTSPGEFGQVDGYLEGEIGSFIGVGPGDKVYVGDVERIQRFDTNGAYVESLPLPGATVQSLAVDPNDGNLYLSVFDPKECGGAIACSLAGIRKLNPAGVALATLPVADPRALATDKQGNVYVVDGFDGIGQTLQVREFSATGTELPGFTFAGGLEESTGIATSEACGIVGAEVLVSNFSEYNSYIGVYGTPPNPADCPPPKVAPTISSQYATAVGSDTAAVRAQIAPHFWPDARYYVEYGTGRCSEGGCGESQPAAPGSPLTPATTNATVTTAPVALSDLRPGTTYYYRFVAVSSGGGPVRGVGGEDGSEGRFTTFSSPSALDTSCANQLFRTGPAARLADCRAYEMVSPIEKNGGNIEALISQSAGPEGVHKTLLKSRIDQAAPEGNKLTYSASRSFAGSQSAGWSSQYLAVRDPLAGWANTAISPPRAVRSLDAELSTETPFRGFSEDLCNGWVYQDTGLALAPGAPVGVPNLYRQRDCGGEPYELLTSVAPPGYGVGEGEHSGFNANVQGFSADGAHTVLHANAKLTENACSTKGVTQLYESSETAPLRLVSVLPGGRATCGQASLGTAAGINPRFFRNASVSHAVSTDGSRVYWTDSGAQYGRPGVLYLRINAQEPQSTVTGGRCTEPALACTITISAANASFWAANPTGSLVIFQAGEDLYEARLVEESEHLVPHATLIAEGFQGLLGTSTDAERVYLVSTKSLAVGATAGRSNVYLYQRGGDFRYITSLPGLDESRGALSPSAIEPYFHSARVTPDGMHAVFTSRGALTGYDNTDAVNGLPDAEVFYYDAQAGEGHGKLSCVSCNPSGARPTGREEGIGEELGTFMVDAAIPAWETEHQASRVLADDGSRVFFESVEPLVLADTNGERDVYEWEAAGAGDCVEGAGAFSQAADGCVSLISSGESPGDSEFIDASADGRDVFFATGASLSPQDTGLVDIYDARAGGGFPPPEIAPAACEGEACQGTPAPPASDSAPQSAAFSGPGNLIAALAPAKTAAQIKAVKLSKALRACRKKRKPARKRCERAARTRYGMNTKGGQS